MGDDMTRNDIAAMALRSMGMDADCIMISSGDGYSVHDTDAMDDTDMVIVCHDGAHVVSVVITRGGTVYRITPRGGWPPVTD